MVRAEYKQTNNHANLFAAPSGSQNADMADKSKLAEKPASPYLEGTTLTFGERMKWARLQSGLTQSQLSERSGLSQPMISAIERGEYDSSAKTASVAAACGVRGIWLEKGLGPRTDREAHSTNVFPGPELRQVPIISWVAASDFAQAVDNFQPGHAEEYADTTAPVHQHTYALRVDGPSMTRPSGEEPTFQHGSVIIVEPNLIDSPEKLVNRFVIVRRHDEDTATFKQLIRDGGRFYLHPLNPQFPNIPLEEGDVFCGVVRQKAPVRYV